MRAVLLCEYGGAHSEESPAAQSVFVVDTIQVAMDPQFEAVYANIGRPSVQPERLLKLMLQQILFTIGFEHLIDESIEYSLRCRWFVGLAINDPVLDQSTFSQNRDRLFNEGLASVSFKRDKALVDRKLLISNEHFSVDITLIDAWASHKIFRSNDDEGPLWSGRNLEVVFKRQIRANDTDVSNTGTGARLTSKSEEIALRLCHIDYHYMDNCNGRVADVANTVASGMAERQAALNLQAKDPKRGATVCANKGYVTANFVVRCSKAGVTSHVARRKTGSRLTAARLSMPATELG